MDMEKLNSLLKKNTMLMKLSLKKIETLYKTINYNNSSNNRYNKKLNSNKLFNNRLNKKYED